MKIAFLTTQINLKTGGGSNLSPHLKALSMCERGHRVSIIALFPEKNSFSETPPYSVIEIPTRFKNWFLLQIKIFFVLKKYENSFDIFSFEGEHFIWGAGLYRLLGGTTPVLMHLNGPIFSLYEHGSTFNATTLPRKSIKTKISDALRVAFEKHIGLVWANHIDIFTADSPLVKNWHEKFGFRADKLTVLPAFVDLELFFAETAPTPKMPKDKINLLYVGRLVPEKGVDSLLEAVRNMGDKKNIMVHIIGNGRQKDSLVELVKTYKIEENILFYPWMNKSALSKMYHSADIFVHPARWAEPLGLTVVEAMASGLPVIVPEISGSAWAAGEGGLTFKNGSSHDLREKIERLINDLALRTKLATIAASRAKQFDYRNSIVTLENIFNDIMMKNPHGKSL